MMNKEQAEKALEDLARRAEYLSIGRDYSTLDGEFTADELEAVAWLMRDREQ